MLVVLVKNNPFANPGAASNRLLALLKGLQKSETKILLCILGGYRSVEELTKFYPNGVFEDFSYRYLSTRHNVSIWQRRLSEYLTSSIDIYFIKRRINSIIQKNDDKIIFWLENDYLCYRVISGIPKIERIRLFMEINEFPDINLTNNSSKYFWQNLLNRKSLRVFYNSVLPRLDGVALMTKALLFYFKDLIKNEAKFLHLPMSVDFQRFDVTKKYVKLENLDCRYICFIGSMNDAKDGVLLLIEAFARINQKYPDYKLALFGFWAYDTANHLKRIKELGINNKVVYSKPIDSLNVVNLIMNSEVLVLPRPDSRQARGGFPTKLGEYLATARPVIVTSVGEIPDYLVDGESAFLVKPGDIDALVEKLIYVIENPKIAEFVAKNGRIIAEKNFCSIQLARGLSDFLGQL